MPRITSSERLVQGGQVYDPASGASSTEHTHPNLDVLNQLSQDTTGLTFKGDNVDADLEQEAW